VECPSSQRSVLSVHRRAQSIIELAFVLPTFLLLMLGAVDLGRAFYESIAIQNSAQVGSVTALDYTRNVSGGGNAAVTGAIKSSTNPDIFPFLQIQDADISMSILWQQDTPYTITVTRNFRLLTPLMANIVSGGQPLTLRAVVHGRQNCSGGC
jgi:Flp pilus assembly protein TadG